MTDAKKDNPIWQHHMQNLKNGSSVKNEDGSISTVRTIIMGDGQSEYLIPTVWDGQILSDEDAWDRAMSSGVDWPKAPSTEEGIRALEDYDKATHEGMTTSNYVDEQMNNLQGFAEGGSADDQTKNAFTRIEDISAQNRPLIAGPDDTVVGFDELGGTVYRSKTGQEYTLYPETKTKQERPIVTAAKAVGEYLSDPSLPSLEETSEFAKEAVKGAYEPFRKIASGDSPTYGDLAEVLPAGLSGTAARVFSKDFKPDTPFRRDILDDTEFEPLDEETLFPKAKTKAPIPPAKFTGDQVLTPEEGLASIKSDNLYETTQYDPTTMLGQIAYNKKKVLESLKDKELLKLAQDLPHYKDKDYWSFLDTNIKPVASYLGVDENDFISLLNDIGGYYPAKKDPQLLELTEKPLPEKAPIGPRAGVGPERPSDKKAEALGFKDIVYHTSTKKGPFVDFPEEFTEFDLASSTGSDRTSQDLLGVHVGTARAAAERNLYVREDPGIGEAGDAKGYTMELRARTTDPVTKQEISKMFKKKPEELFDDPTGPFTEMDVNTLIREYEDLLYPADTLLPADSREVAAVNFRRELAREGFTHIPYINDVEDPGSISFIMLVDRPKGSPAVLRDVRAQFDPKKITSPDLRFAEGGMVEEDQMRRLMQEGGMTDDGMSIEPVTGNEIPPGSMASEVRDDIPAQLSEGEYIVPADVVRFFGVRFFEELRNQAKQALAEMDADGRIGGTPVDSRGVPMEAQDEELTPEEQQMLMEALGASGMAYGGMVEGQPISTPYQDQATMYQVPAGMAEGGVTAPFDRTKFKLSDYGSGGIEARKYINPTTKEERTVQFLDGIPLGIIPEGFVPWTQELADKPTTPTTPTDTVRTQEVKVERGEGRGGDRDNQPTTGEGSTGYQGWAAENYDAITSNPMGYAAGVYSEATQPKGFVGRAFGRTGLGGIVNDVTTMDAISKLEAAQSRTKPGSTEDTAIQGMIDNLAGTIDTNVAEALYGLGVAGTGKQRINALDMYGANKTSVAPGISKTSTAPTSGTGTSSNKGQDKGVNIGYGEGKVDPGLAAAAGIGRTSTAGTTERAGGRDQQGSTGVSAGTSAGTSPGRADRDQQGSTGTGGNKSTGGSSYGGGINGGANEGRRATGGLVSKKGPSKSKSKKGLAS